MYPLCWAVVEGETNDSWRWFFAELRKVLDDTDGTSMTFISDEAQAVLNGVANVFPKAEHRDCARHVFAYWHNGFKGDEMKMLFWNVAKAYNKADYENALAQMEKVSPAAVDAFKSYNPECFCRAFVKKDTRCDVIVNNMAETFNGYIINARTKHLIFMLEDIRSALMQRLVLKKQEIEKIRDEICPRVRIKLNKEKALAAECTIIPSTITLFQVSYKLDTVTVDLVNKSCTCGKWDLLGVPCCHACACIFFIHEEPEKYVDACYKTETYLKIYSASIPPCVGERYWPKVDLPIDPPPIKIGPGRPRRNRRKTPHEHPKILGKLTRHGVEMSCSVCKSKEHNKRRCPDKDKGTQIPPQPKRKRGRPRAMVVQHSRDDNGESTQNMHHQQTAEPSTIGRNGRDSHKRKG
ncbi:uncharacterized protein LOC110710015 [Chenopodium quinoa]|uniref:uncharacterized protein LOC110710015 n=1 Tax=Chenopodium quinoa TaxID=63459 RepID=UPI000B7897A0|nr:uncharacterized protein LOC110710015 [Chenopodium quinoa]